MAHNSNNNFRRLPFAPTEAEMIKHTLDRLNVVSGKLGIEPTMLTRKIVGDNRIVTDLEQRMEILMKTRVKVASGRSRSMSLRTYEKLHRGMDEYV